MEDDKFIPDLDMNVPVAYAAFEVVMDEDNQKQWIPSMCMSIRPTAKWWGDGRKN